MGGSLVTCRVETYIELGDRAKLVATFNKTAVRRSSSAFSRRNKLIGFVEYYFKQALVDTFICSAVLTLSFSSWVRISPTTRIKTSTRKSIASLSPTNHPQATINSTRSGGNRLRVRLLKWERGVGAVHARERMDKRKVNSGGAAEDLDERASKRRKLPNVSRLSGCLSRVATIRNCDCDF